MYADCFLGSVVRYAERKDKRSAASSAAGDLVRAILPCGIYKVSCQLKAYILCGLGKASVFQPLSPLAAGLLPLCGESLRISSWSRAFLAIYMLSVVDIHII